MLLDLVMPQMDGFEVLAYMNKEHWIDYIPVIIISAEDSPAYIKRGYDLGVTDFIGKPFDGNMVRRRFAGSKAAPNDKNCNGSNLRKREEQQADG